VGVPLAFLARVWVAALVAAATARGILIAVEHRGPILLAVIVLSVYGILFFGVSTLLKLPEAQAMLGILRRRAGMK
jgi:hypothetical protein